MVMLIRKLIGNYKERWIFGSIIVIAANSGGAWSPIGDVTTIMLWVRGNISTSATIPHLFLPSLVSALVPVLIISRYLHGKVTPPNAFEENRDNLLLKVLKANEKLAILCIGVFCLLFVPVFKTITHLPPFMGILMGVGILWIFTELMYRKTPINEDLKLRLSKVVSRIDGATLMFFLGILLAYGFISPLASVLRQKSAETSKMMQCVKVILLSNLNGYAPPIAVEFGRKTLYSSERPSFVELEEHVRAVKNPQQQTTTEEV